MKNTGAFLTFLLALGLLGVVSAEAGQFRLGHKYYQLTDDEYQVSQYQDQEDNVGGYAISPSQAASIAKRTWVGAKVLRVQLLPSGVYAVTLKKGGQVSRVLVDASSGALV